RNTTSGGLRLALASPSSAVAATSTRHFSRSKARRSAHAIGSSSSMMSTECGIGATADGCRVGTLQSYTIRGMPSDGGFVSTTSTTEEPLMLRMFVALMTALAATTA